jgi:vacuolar-type H+-ATPase subunit E/Vma4
VILKNFQVKIKNQVMMAQRKILKTFQMNAKNYVLMLEKRNIVKIFQMKVKNPQKPLIAMMMMNFSLQVKKKI